MTEPPVLVDRYPAALFDLDGVVYLGPQAVPGAAEGIAGLRDRGVRIGFVTNNAARPPAAVAAHLNELGVPADPSDVVTSAQAGARLVADRFGSGARVLAVGGPGVSEALREAGLQPVASADDGPVAVLQGYGTDLTWNDLIEAAVAVQRGAHWTATNTDSTRPTDRGIAPGNGAAVQAVRAAVHVDPEVAGKPFRPLIDETLRRLEVTDAIFVGDRIDTDVEGAVRAGLDSLMVFTGAHGPADLLAAGPGERPTAIGWDLRALLAPARPVGGDPVERDRELVRAEHGSVVAVTDVADREAALDLLAAATRLVWPAADRGEPLDTAAVITTLTAALRPARS
ncbi:HAD superfamily hydrolase (TIGR01450 family) [Friedmanniella endophytica]|uniref:HAD superfamily hydrolase (TIGR01450 family) n=1 Tax=Microlunatus kandeliicorticis TaxID=1759536 RepID=A0A7W3IUB9_9ACTN|nr:HAD-IIA family hydrolase [Microlunatus kandeliicorticis]MBA8795280.1 HAD superfamily hydrolase (TIGR01450 family) [Microlunatus kandeliicorticis]